MTMACTDIKPSNILIDFKGFPVLTDFEIARDDSLLGTVTVVAAPRGTYPYMSPEVIQLNRGGAPADVWAVAVMFADCFYIEGDLAAQGQACVLYTDMPREALVPAPPQPGPGVPPDGLLVATQQMLSLVPEERPSISEVLRRSNTLHSEDAAALRAEEEAPALRSSNLTKALGQSRESRPGRRPQVVVRREHILDSLAPQLTAMNERQIRHNWDVSFENEDGIDQGGVHIDLITCACADFEARCVELTSDAGLWTLKSSDALDLPGYAEAMGRLIGHALCQNPPIPMPLRLCSGIYQAALGTQEMLDLTSSTFATWKQKGWASWGEGQYQMHLRWLREMDPSGELLRGYQQAPGLGMDLEGLCQDGASEAVTEENSKWFVLFTVHQKLFGRGLAEVVRRLGSGLRAALGDNAHEALKALPGHELLLRIEGQRHITGGMLWRAIDVKEAIGNEHAWLERAVKGMSEDQILLLLRFATSHVRLQLDGRLRPNSAGMLHALQTLHASYIYVLHVYPEEP